MAHERVFFPTSNTNNNVPDAAAAAMGGGGRGGGDGARGAEAEAAAHVLKAEIVSHPLFENLLRAHVQCLSVGLPPGHVRALEDQLAANTHGVAIKYLMLSKDMMTMMQRSGDVTSAATTPTSTTTTAPLLLRSSTASPSHSKDIDEFMENYLQLLLVLRRHLEECAVPPSANAMDALCELEQAFCDLTGTSPSDLTSTMTSSSTAALESHEMNEAENSSSGGVMMMMMMNSSKNNNSNSMADVETAAAAGGYTGAGAWLQEAAASSSSNACDQLVGGAGEPPLADSFYDIDRSLFEFVRMELKHKLKDRYRESIVAIRDEIIRKRLAGKLPGDVTVLKKWWNAHSKWPYPTEEEKKKMMEETGLEMRQINNWFINHRKRNWNNRASSSIGSTSQQ